MMLFSLVSARSTTSASTPSSPTWNVRFSAELYWLFGGRKCKTISLRYSFSYISPKVRYGHFNRLLLQLLVNVFSEGALTHAIVPADICTEDKSLIQERDQGDWPRA
ncbi:hypothetical protein BJX76DRAFT_329537 [Aspergillus varians]